MDTKSKVHFDRTVQILVDAFMTGTLEHGNFCGCAVGNLIARNSGYEIKHQVESTWCGMSWVDPQSQMAINPEWQQVFMTSMDEQKLYPQNFKGVAKRQILATGYSLDDIMLIESAFESVERPPIPRSEEVIEAWNFAGLMAVVDALADIHRIDIKAKENAKALFVK